MKVSILTDAFLLLLPLVLAVSPCRAGGEATATTGRWQQGLLLVQQRTIAHYPILRGSTFHDRRDGGSSSGRKNTINNNKRRAFIGKDTKKTNQVSAPLAILKLRGGGGDAAEFVDHAYDWATNLGAPAALVAGAVIATLYESMSSGNLDIDEDNDTRWIKIAKQTTHMFLLVAFILQIICIFCTTILGTHLMSKPPISSEAFNTPLDYLKSNFEFEYLTSRISFLQGLITWLAAIALEHTIPHSDPTEPESKSRRQMDILIASSLTTLIIMMMSFYNGHMNYYSNYFEMLWRYTQVVWSRYVMNWPPRPLTILAMPTLCTSIVYFFKVFLHLEDGEAVKSAKKKK